MEKRSITIHRNGIEKFFMAVKDYVKHHRRPALLVIAAVVVLSGLLIGGAFYYDVRSSRELLTYEDAVAAFSSSDRGDAAFDTMMKQLVPLVESSKWGYVSRHGEYILGGLYFDQKKYADAQKHYEKYADCSKSAFAPLALLQAGACAEESGNYDKALEIYKSFGKKFKDSGFTDRSVYDLGRMYQKKGDIAAARDQFNKIVTQYPKSPFNGPAKARLLVLGMAN
jgi:tetratricopeptide (TPR) repeat protein